jgi:hypothetical protein
MFQNPFIHTSVMFNREFVWGKLSGYNETFRYNQDFELWSRVIEKARTANLEDTLVDFRVNPFSVTKLTPGKRDSFEVNFAMNVGIQKTNIKRLLGPGPWEAWPLIWSEINVPYILQNIKQKEGAFSLLQAIEKRFFILRPEARGTREIAAVSAGAYWKLADYFAGNGRTKAIKAYKLALLNDRRRMWWKAGRLLVGLCGAKGVIRYCREALRMRRAASKSER